MLYYDFKYLRVHYVVLDWQRQCLAIHQSQQSNSFPPVLMLTQDAFESKGREETGLLSHWLPWHHCYVWNREHHSDPAEDYANGQHPVCSFIQEGILSSDQDIVCLRNSNRKTTDNEQNPPWFIRALSEAEVWSLLAPDAWPTNKFRVSTSKFGLYLPKTEI